MLSELTGLALSISGVSSMHDVFPYFRYINGYISIHVINAGSAVNSTGNVLILSLPETIKGKSMFRALRRVTLTSRRRAFAGNSKRRGPGFFNCLNLE